MINETIWENEVRAVDDSAWLEADPSDPGWPGWAGGDGGVGDPEMDQTGNGEWRP